MAMEFLDQDIDIKWARKRFTEKFAGLSPSFILSPTFESHALTLARLEFSLPVRQTEYESLSVYLFNSRSLPPIVPDINLNSKIP